VKYAAQNATKIMAILSQVCCGLLGFEVLIGMGALPRFYVYIERRALLIGL
jgi:hypothetical protein